MIGSYADPAADVGEGVGAHGWDHGLGEIVNALIEAGPGIESLVEHPFLDWDVDFLTKAPDGTFRLPQGTVGSCLWCSRSGPRNRWTEPASGSGIRIQHPASGRTILANSHMSTLCAFGACGASGWPGERTAHAQGGPWHASCETQSDRERA